MQNRWRKVRWRQETSQGDPCSLPDQRWSLGQGEEGCRATGAWGSPWGTGEVMARTARRTWWAGTHATGRGGGAHVSRSPASGHQARGMCHTSHVLPKVSFLRGIRAPTDGSFLWRREWPCPGRHGLGNTCLPRQADSCSWEGGCFAASPPSTLAARLWCSTGAQVAKCLRKTPTHHVGDTGALGGPAEAWVYLSWDARLAITVRGPRRYLVDDFHQVRMRHACPSLSQAYPADPSRC